MAESTTAEAETPIWERALKTTEALEAHRAFLEVSRKSISLLPEHIVEETPREFAIDFSVNFTKATELFDAVLFDIIVDMRRAAANLKAQHDALEHHSGPTADE